MIDSFTKEYLEEVLKDFGGDWTPEQRYNEWIYSAPHGRGRVIVSSSISVDGSSRDNGKDSIRVVLEHSGVHKKTSKRWITRMPDWEARLRQSILEARITINQLDYNPKCPNCDGAMVVRSGVHGKFYGCLKFPRCRGTRGYEVPDKELFNILQM